MTTRDIDSIRDRIETLESAGRPQALAETLADAIEASVEADTCDRQAAWIDRLEELDDRHDAAAIRSSLVRGVAAATTVEGCQNRQEKLSADDIRRYRDRLDALYDDDDPERAERLAFATTQLVAAHADANDLEAIADEIPTLNQLHERHGTEAIAAHLADALLTEADLHFALDRGESSEIHANYQLIETLAREYPGERLNERLAGALSYAARASYTRGRFDFGEAERLASRIEGLYKRYQSDEMAYWLAHGTHPKVWSYGNNEKFQAAEAAIDRVERLLEEHDDDRLPKLLGWYYRNAVYHRVEAERSAAVEQKLDRLAAFYEEHDDVARIANYYANALRSAATYYFDEEGDFEAGHRKLDRLADLYEAHDPSETGIPNRYARALASGVEANVERGDIDAAMSQFERIRDLVGDEADVGTPLTAATEALADFLFDQQDVDELDRIVSDLWTVVEEPTDRFVAAELQTRLNLQRGHWWPDDTAFEVEIEEETASTVQLRVIDRYDIEHVITVGADGKVSTNAGEGDVPQDLGDYSSDLSSFQRRLLEFVRGQAVYWVHREHEFDVLEPHLTPGGIETVREAVADLSTDEVADLFDEYLAQHASHSADEVPFCDPVERPVDPDGVDLDDDAVRYEVWVAVEDGSVNDVSELQIAVIDRDERTVVREAAVPDGEAYARVSLPVRLVQTPEQLQTVIDENLRCQQRDRCVAFGLEPPEHCRLLGTGQHSLTTVYQEFDEIPDFYEVDADVPGYERGITADELLRDYLTTVFSGSEWGRSVRDAYDDAPETVPEPPTIAASSSRG
ncbi:hypothetical protein [Halopiger goleimassiliensis]|uniref:hypothetical protein n=1 Tax=Halopiger goleimassiliensis TaxID=1293048 RepID=UPI000677922D|nr:hypothetical protein [Halopiger goleimassiliensis]